MPKIPTGTSNTTSTPQTTPPPPTTTTGASAKTGPTNIAASLTGADALERRRVGGASLDPTASVKGAKATTTLPNIGEVFPIGALSEIDGKGLGGQSFMLDGGSLRGLKLQIRRIKDGDQPGFEIVFQLTEDKIPAALERMKTKEAKPAAASFRGATLGEDGIAKYTEATGTIGTGSSHSPPDLNSSSSSWALALEDPKGGKIDMVHDKAALAIRGLTRIHLRGDDKKCTEQLQSLIKNVGLAHVFAPPTPKTKQINTMMRALWQADHKAARELAAGDLDKLKPADLAQALESAGFDAKRIESLHYKEVFPGHFTVMDPMQKEAMVAAGARYCYSTVTDPEHVYSILTGGQKSSVQRYKEGLIINGMSTNADFVTGGATGVFTRLVTQNAIYEGKSWAGRTYKLVQSHENLARTDWYGWDGDFYGRRWSLESQTNFGVDLVKKIDSGGGYKDYNELIFTAGNRPEVIDRVVATSEADRQKLIKLLKEKDYKPHNGLTIEEFVVLSPQFVLMGPSPFSKVEDLAAFGKEALEKAKNGDTAPLQWLLYEGPKGNERSAVEQQILTDGPSAVQNLLLKAAKMSGSFAMTAPELDAVLAKLATNDVPEGKAILDRLPTEAAEAMFRSGSDKAAEMLLAKKPTSSSSYSPPFGLTDDMFVRIYMDLASKQEPGKPRSKAMELALDLRANHLLTSNHAGFKAFLEKYPQVNPADPKAWLAEKMVGLKTGDTGKADVAMYLAQLTDTQAVGVAQRSLIETDSPAALELLKSTITQHGQVFMPGDALGKALSALPTTSQTRQHLLSSAPAALLKATDLTLLELLTAHHKSSYSKDFGIYGDEWVKVVDAQLANTKGAITDVVKQSMEIGGATLIQQPKFKEKLPSFAGLYEVTDPAAFAQQAITELATPNPGSLKLGWMILGPQAETLRLPALAAILRTDEYNAQNLLAYVRSADGKFPATPEQMRGLVADLSTDADPKNKQALGKLLSTSGKEVLTAADAGTLEKLQTHFAGQTNIMGAMGLQAPTVSTLLEELDAKGADAAPVKNFVLTNGSAELIAGNDATFLAYLKTNGIGYEGMGKDAAWAAQTIKTACDAVSYYWNSSYYSSYAQYNKMPDGAASLLRTASGAYDDKVLGEIEKTVKGWGWSQTAFDKFLAVNPELSDEWKAKLTAAYKGA